LFEHSKWIKASEYVNEGCYDFYKSVELEKKPEKAVLSITAIGLYCAHINGKRVGNEILTPYWTEYKYRLQYQTYDVTEMLEKDNEISIVCAEGWAIGLFHTRPGHRTIFGDNPALIFELELQFDDGTKRSIVSDESMNVRTSHIVSSSIYNGETVDKTAKIRELGKAQPDAGVETNIVEQVGEKVLEQDIITPVSYFVTPKGERVIDFGQNFAGYVELTISGKHGDRVVLSHAEVLDKDGNFYTENLRIAKARNTYVLSGEGTEMFKPTFTWQGFRYVRLDEYPSDEVDLSMFKGIVIHSDMKKTCEFVCGNDKINQLYHNIVWGQKSNFIDVPTDCPQRNERLGWTGDAQVFAKTAAINFDVERFFKKWLLDLAARQRECGAVDWFIPTDVYNWSEKYTSSAWGDAATICPWQMYMAYGNKEILENQFDSMKKWVDYIRSRGDEEYLWLGDRHFGDWLAMDKYDGSYHGATDTDYIASAYYAYSTSLVVKAGKVLGKDVSEYEKLYDNIVKAFKAKYFENGKLNQNTQTACTLALFFDLCDDKKSVADKLAALVRDNGTRITTGFVGTPYIMHALSDNGYADVAMDLLLQEKIPSWLYSVNHGATTMWEHWDGIREDGTFWSKDMNSYNHYAYGAVFDWMFENISGIKVLPDGAGYTHIQIKPIADRRLGFAKTQFDSRQGTIRTMWNYKGDLVHYEFEIPNGVTAEIVLPNVTKTVTGGRYMFECKIK